MHNNGTYNTLLYAIAWLIAIGFTLTVVLKTNFFKSLYLLAILLISLLISSQQYIAGLGIPFHWFLIILGFPIINTNSNLLKSSFLYYFISLCVLIYSPISFAFALLGVLALKKVKSLAPILNTLVLVHPLGLIKQNKQKLLSKIIILTICLIAFKLNGMAIHVLGPIQYLLPPLKMVSAAIIAYIALSEISSNIMNFNRSEFLSILSIFILVLIAHVININFLKWGFEYIFFPIFMWIGVFLMVSQPKNTVNLNADQKYE